MIQDNQAPIADRGLLRKNIRNKVVEILKDKTAAGSRVFGNPSITAWESELPVIHVFPRNESVSKFNESPREWRRDLDLTIEILAKGPDTNLDLGTPESGVTSLADILDDLVEQVECEMSRDETLQCEVDDSFLQSVDFEFDASGAQPIGSARLNYSAVYMTMSPRDTGKQGVTDDFTKAVIDYNLSEDENTREAQDVLDIPQS